MSVSGISSSNFLSDRLDAQNTQSKGTHTQTTQSGPSQQLQNDLNQLSQDLQSGSGSLAQAEKDFTAIITAHPGLLSPATSSSANSSGVNAVKQAFSALYQDLQSPGNLTAAQQDFATLQQAVQQLWNQHNGQQQPGADSQHASSASGTSQSSGSSLDVTA